MALLPAGRALSLAFTPAGLDVDPLTSKTLNPAALAAAYDPPRFTVKWAVVVAAVVAAVVAVAVAVVVLALTVLVVAVVAVVVVAVDVSNAVRAKLPAAKERAMGNMQGPQRGLGARAAKKKHGPPPLMAIRGGSTI